eukprot:TRINITY_DN564_c0_g2_i1.p1 TRINITY_DN564_c0_g2~~TRINITY_DN564_c0_g2_i1.p1  ORF type:complete len:321 (+),score=43.02 TRINITY_DN564_c0_g2_i1:236-1198(+)
MGFQCQYCGNEIVNPTQKDANNNRIDTNEKQKWRKILFTKQAYEDNYTDTETFLIELVQNANFQQYDYMTVVVDSATVTQQVTVVVLFCMVFQLAYSGKVGLPFLLLVVTFMLIFGYIIRILTDSNFNLMDIVGSTMQIALVFGCVFGLSPVLRTLTDAFSDDTIWALTSIMLIAHTFFHDYGYINGVDRSSFDAPVSLNAAIFASILLGSRLTSSLHAFCLISTAIEVFALFPIMCRHLKQFSLEFHLGLTLLLFVLASFLLFSTSILLALVYIGAVFITTFICPAWLIYMQKYKKEINGPWDEATVRSFQQLGIADME